MVQHVSDDDMRAGMAGSKEYTAVILEAGPAYGTAEAGPVIWEHARRNFALRADGLLNIVCPVTDDSEVRGIGILDADPDTARSIMAEDPGVKAGVFTFTLHPVRSFPGDRLH
ncbi:hypothetical protein ACFYXS_26450 [Streptomyces sp. NPDC002574]|uniref:hypothetical protein n=1 Tax=Streptomyces sp. NPDC002574 TaxID=3364652 RepID=UPI00369488B6